MRVWKCVVSVGEKLSMLGLVRLGEWVGLCVGICGCEIVMWCGNM